MTKKGCLYLIPNTLGPMDDISSVMTKHVWDIIPTIKGFIAENAKNARAFLKHFDLKKPMYEVTIKVVNKRTQAEEIKQLLQPMRQGENWGLLSDAGCPAIADPGADLIRLAHQHTIRVIPLVGPSSIFLALMASGLNGQNFVFHGYLPRSPRERISTLKELERDSYKYHRTQIFMETPYRNVHMVRDMFQNLRRDTEVCIATDITLPDETIQTKKVREWRESATPNVHKKPTIFIISAHES